MSFSPLFFLTVTLDNPDGRLMFGCNSPTSQATTQPTTIVAMQPATRPAPIPAGSIEHFSLFGIGASLTLGDAVVRVTANIAGRAGGVILTQNGVTVFWFNNASIKITPTANAQWAAFQTVQGDEVFRDFANRQPVPSVTMAAQASISVLGMAANAPQLQNLRIGIVQNVTRNVVTAGFGWPTVAKWNYGGPFPIGTLGAPGSIYLIDTAAGTHNDTAIGVAPLFDKPGPDQKDPNSLAIPLGLPNGGPATSRDGPSVRLPASVAITANTNTGDPLVTATLSYLLRFIAVDEKFADWAVLYDVKTGKVIAPLRETNWNLNVGTGKYDGKTATALPNDYAPTGSAPVLTGVFANDAPRTRTIVKDGAVVFTYPNIQPDVLPN